MIITEQKPFDEILNSIKEYKNVFLLGCSECAAICQTGGSEQVKEMAAKLEENGKKIITGTLMIDSPCDERITKRDVRLVKEEIEKADVLVSMACGLGTQSLTTITGKKVVPALNTKFYGTVERLGRFHEKCCGCDSCVLLEHGGECPVVKRKKCKSCGRLLQYDSKNCDICKSEDLEVTEARTIIW
ncbi:MAG: methylenetetrahydrofolate reductase C-terminal domain-containing protein [Candidatus Hodarchaeota archaeon]